MFLEIDDLSFAYPGKGRPWVLEGCGLGVEAGERVGVSGPSGQGKSTLLRLIAGLERPQKGRIVIDGKVVASAEHCLAPEARQVGMVFQDYGLFPHMTVAQNIAYGLWRQNKKARRERMAAMLELIRMTEFSARYPYEISGGQQQRAALARALAPNPKLLLLDEPLSNLDAALKTEIRAEMRALMEQSRLTCLFVSHDLDDLQAVCTRIVQIRDPAPEAKSQKTEKNQENPD
ncbi:MAG: ATP-binding cassette domain-containing protein [Zoogloeaceae bacterium]|jgi:iron(III) transport system ATP-binding protein|nr:ATP-binding cassette domain-containing protein [Zoogloeaceae bacterium]